MAGTISQAFINELQEELLCTICMENSDLKELPCQHSYCTTCITQMKHYFTKRLTCPECRIVHKLPKEKADGFPANRLVHRLNEKLERHQKAMGNPSEWLSAPSDFPETASSSVDAPTKEAFQGETCQLSAHKGPSKCCEVFCNFCKNTMCTRCGLLSVCANHKQHICIDIEQAFIDARKSLTDSAAIYKLLAHQKEASKTALQTELNTLHEKQTEIGRQIREIEDHVDRYNEEATRVESLAGSQDLLSVIADAQKISIDCREFERQLPAVNAAQAVGSQSEYHEVVAAWLEWFIKSGRDAFKAIQQNPEESFVYIIIALLILWLSSSKSEND